MKPLTDAQLQALLDQWRGNAGICEGIMQAHRAAGGDCPESYADIFSRIWGV